MFLWAEKISWLHQMPFQLCSKSILHFVHGRRIIHVIATATNNEWVHSVLRPARHNNRPFSRWVFPRNHLHWYWQLKPNSRNYTKTHRNHENKLALVKKNTKKSLNQTCTYITSWMYKPFNSFCPCTCILFRYSIYRMTYSHICKTVHCLHHMQLYMTLSFIYGACNRIGPFFQARGRGENCFLHGQAYSILG